MGKLLVRLSTMITALASAVAILACPLASTAAAVSSSTYESDVIKYTNVEGTDRDKKAVKASSCIDRFAEKQAKAMAEQKKMFHQALLPILETCDLSEVGENVAFGFTSGKAVTGAWMNSPAHNANLLNSKHRLIGVGAVQSEDGIWYVSQVFGRLA